MPNERTAGMGATGPALAEDAALPAGQRRALIVKLGSIGDVVMAIPGAAQLHAAGFEVLWLVSEAIAPVLRLYPWISVVPVDERRLLRSGSASRIGAMGSLWQTLRALPGGTAPFDLIATLYYDPRYRLLTLPLRAKRRVVLTHDGREATLLPGRHHTDEYARILTGAPDTERPTQLAPVPVTGRLPPSPLPLDAAKPRVVLVPAGARNVLRDDALRRWPVENYVALATALRSAGCEVVLSGGPDDAWASPHFASLVAESGVVDRIGKLTLVETLALMESAAVSVTHDTGPLHLAGLTSTGIVTIFGPTDPRGRLPRRGNTVALWGGEGFACRPCYDGRDYAPCPDNGCMRQVTPDAVLAEVRRLLRARDAGETLPPRIWAPEPTPASLVQLKEEV